MESGAKPFVMGRLSKEKVSGGKTVSEGYDCCCTLLLGCIGVAAIMTIKAANNSIITDFALILSAKVRIYFETTKFSA